jgi:hypothetical protein
MKRAIEPDPDWQPPERVPCGEDPAEWRCDVPGCKAHPGLIRVSDYSEPFRGRCADHLNSGVARYLHIRRNQRTA